MALNLYNVFEIEKSDEWNFINFPKEYQNEDNLIVYSMKKAYEAKNHQIIKAKIVELDQDVPNTRGLGSSATCIVAGIMGANYLMGNVMTKAEMLQIAAKIEGYPDNVTPALFGGLTASYHTDEGIRNIKYAVANDLKFLTLIPPSLISTKESRKKLPHELTYEDIVYNTSRIVNLPYAFSSGHLSLIRDIISDRMHEPYRLPLIEGADIIKDFAKKNKLPMFLSGSGSTMIIIYKDELDYHELDKLGFDIKVLSIDHTGARYEE